MGKAKPAKKVVKNAAGKGTENARPKANRNLQLLTKHAEDLVYKICRRYIEGEYAGTIANEVNRELAVRKIPELEGVKLKDQSVRQLVMIMERERYIFFHPPVTHHLHQSLMKICDCTPDETSAERIHVVNHRESDPNRWESVAQAVADRAADLCFDLIHRIARFKKDKHVHLGLGAGRTSRRVARRLGELLRTAHDLRKNGVTLTVHALSPGFDPRDPLTSPAGTFTLLEDSAPEIRFLALFTDPVVRSEEEFRRTRSLLGVKVSFEEKDKIDLVISSLGNPNNQGLWGRYAQEYAGVDATFLKTLNKYGWAGDFQFRPYSTTQPITAELGIRAMTLFELKDYCEMAAQKNKHVVLVCGPGKTDALIPLLTQPDLRVWDYAVFDVDTAEAIDKKLNPNPDNT